MKCHEALIVTLAVTALALLPACRNTAEGVKEDSRQNAEQARKEAHAVKEESKAVAHEIGETAKDVGGQVAEGAKEVGQQIAQGAKEIGTEVGAKKKTVDVKAALMLDKSIDASHIDVDTDAVAKTVTLKGSVPSAAQKAAAERLARDEADGYAVNNFLTVVKKP